MTVELGCPLRPGEACTLCEPGASTPATCPAVYLVMSDPEQRARLAGLRREHRQSSALATGGGRAGE